MTQEEITQQLYDNLKQEVEQVSNEAELDIITENKRLIDCMKNQTTLHIEWERFYTRAKRILGRAEEYVDRCYSYAFVNELQNNQRSLGTTECKHYAMVNKDYVNAKLFFNDVKALKEDIEAVLSVIKSRQFALRDIETALINDLGNTII